MRPMRCVLLAAFFVLSVACVIGTPGTGGGGTSGLLTDPSAGLEKLDHYRAEVDTLTKALVEGEAVEQSSSATLSVWADENAIFLTTAAETESGDTIPVTLGRVDRAGYVLMGADTGCRTYWDQDNIQVTPQDLGIFVPNIKSAAKVGEETVNGIAAIKYALDPDSTGLKGIQAAGNFWLAKDGGFLVKYHAELSGGDELLGAGATGTHTVDYILTEINDGSAVDYPGDCRPVLTDIPAMDDARNLERQPDAIFFDSPSAPDKVLAFYRDYFEGAGWDSAGNLAKPNGEIDEFFLLQASGREATLILQPLDGGTNVRILTAENSVPSPAEESTPAAGQPDSARIITSVTTLFGNASTPSPLGSYALSATEIFPAIGGGSDTTTVTAEIEGLNYHYITTSGGVTKEGFFLDGQDYEVIGGIVKPGSITIEIGWISWQMDPLLILTSAGMASPKAEPGTTFEGRPVDVFSVDSAGAILPDTSGGLLPVAITSIKGTIWIDQSTGALLKADLEFDCTISKPGGSEPSASGKGEYHLAVSRIGKVKVTLPQ